jgi:hypothetical protein
LLSADTGSLEAVLADDFVIVDVMSGRVTGREEFLAAMGSGMLRFAEVTRFSGDQSVRRREAAGVVVGRTRMVMRFGPDTVTANSRYTHVFVNDDGSWRLMSAQGNSNQGVACLRSAAEPARTAAEDAVMPSDASD